MISKECRHCMQPIHHKARVCHHCRNNQSWVGNQKDPRFVLLGVFLVIFVPLLVWLPKVLSLHQTPLAPPALKIAESTLRYTSTDAGTRVFVVGKTENSSGTDAARVWFRVNLLGVEGQVLDTLLVDQSGLVVPAQSTKTFRVTGLVSVKPEEVNSAEVEIERSSERSRYD